MHNLQRRFEDASTFEAWEVAGRELDNKIPENVAWKHSYMDNVYPAQKVSDRIDLIYETLRNGDLCDARRLVELGMIRNYCNITDPRLYNCLYAGTKRMVEVYLANFTCLLNRVFNDSWNGQVLSKQEKMDISDRSLSAYGNSALVLQSGSIFGLCHIGVMKALHERGLLPRIIVGTGAGALMAALVGIHTDDELPTFLDGIAINLEAFTQRSARDSVSRPAWYEILFNRARRYRHTGYVLHGDTLRRCVEANIGDLTFQEAFNRTGRKISVIISGDSPGIPNLLNKVTTPNVLIRTAAMASLVNDLDAAPAMILQKDLGGTITAWSLNDESPAFREKRRARMRRPSARIDKTIPLRRICSLENVNHFIISQARPYVLPFLVPSQRHSHHPQKRRRINFSPLWRLTSWTVRFWLHFYDSILGLPEAIRRFLVDERITRPSITLVPEVSWSDYLRLLRNPTDNEVKHWISVGEKSVWPHVPALRVRCEIEKTLDRHFQAVREPRYRYTREADGSGSSRRKTRARTSSAGQS